MSILKQIKAETVRLLGGVGTPKRLARQRTSNGDSIMEPGKKLGPHVCLAWKQVVFRTEKGKLI